MRRRLLILAVAFLACLGVAVAVLFFTGPRVRVDAVTGEQVQKGMTLAEVEAIPGGPARNYNVPPWEKNAESSLHMSGTTKRKWVTSEGALEVWFDADGKVVDKNFIPFGFITTVDKHMN